MKTAILLIVFGGALLFAVAAAVFAYRSTRKSKKENEVKQNAKETKPSAAKKRRWLSATAVITVLGFGIWWVFLREKPAKEVAAKPAEVHSCEAWEKTYPVIAGNAFPLDTVRRVGRDRKVRLVVSRTLYVRRGEAWLIRLSPTDTTGWVKFDPAAPKNWSLPGQRVWMIYPDGIRVEDAPGKIIRTSGRNVRRFLGEGCVLVQAAS